MSTTISKLASYNPLEPLAVYELATILADMTAEAGANPLSLTVEPRDPHRWRDDWYLLAVEYKVPSRRKAPTARVSERLIRTYISAAAKKRG